MLSTMLDVGGGTEILRKIREGVRKFDQIFVNVFHPFQQRINDPSKSAAWRYLRHIRCA